MADLCFPVSGICVLLRVETEMIRGHQNVGVSRRLPGTGEKGEGRMVLSGKESTCKTRAGPHPQPMASTLP